MNRIFKIKDNNIYINIDEVYTLLECNYLDDNYATDIITVDEEEYINIDNIILLVAHNYADNKIEILKELADIIDSIDL